jgi:hypothetical protein
MSKKTQKEGANGIQCYSSPSYCREEGTKEMTKKPRRYLKVELEKRNNAFDDGSCLVTKTMPP